eukprot:3409127-Pleurochrysis_carterae.AAC.1
MAVRSATQCLRDYDRHVQVPAASGLIWSESSALHIAGASAFLHDRRLASFRITYSLSRAGARVQELWRPALAQVAVGHEEGHSHAQARQVLRAPHHPPTQPR